MALGVAIIGSIGTAVYRSELSDTIPVEVPPSATEAARETLGGAQTVALELPEQVGAELLDAAREAFTQGLQLAAATSAAVAAGLAILVWFMLRDLRSSSEPSDQGDLEVSLSTFEVAASIAVSDMAQARAFYEDKLGLASSESDDDGSRVYRCGSDTSLHVYPSRAHAGATAATLATWKVADVHAVVDQLRCRGVEPERYDDPELQADADGIHTLSDGLVAWFKDPDGNTLAIEERR